jgi:hypothetical protein
MPTPGPDEAQSEGNRSDYDAADGVFRGRLSRNKSKKQSAPWRLQFLFFHMPRIWCLLAVLCVCVTFGHLSSASRFVRACSIGAVHGVALHIVQVAKGRPLRLMRINGRSIFISACAVERARNVDFQWRAGYVP